MSQYLPSRAPPTCAEAQEVPEHHLLMEAEINSFFTRLLNCVPMSAFFFFFPLFFVLPVPLGRRVIELLGGHLAPGHGHPTILTSAFHKSSEFP